MKIGVRIRDYDQLVGSLAARRRSLGLRQLETDDLSGCQPGYQGKIESQTRRLGKLSLPMILAALDADLLLVPRSETAPVHDRGMSANKADRVERWATTEN
jgi:hypothetical protein